MRKCLGKIRGLADASLNFLVKHSKCFYTASVVSLIFMLVIFFSEIKHANEISSMQKDTAALIVEFDQLSREGGEIIILQSETIEKSTEGLKRATTIIKVQEEIIKQLILRMQEGGLLPAPKPPIEPRLAI